MSEKLNHSDLSAMLAKETGLSVAKADAFTKALFDIVIEGLEQDGIVKINGLGTFKITDVADRSSINVNTGEKIEIKGHKKLTFVPAESLKECVNRPFAMFEPVEIDDNYQDEGENDDDTVVPVAEEVKENASAPFNAAEIEEEMPLEDDGKREVDIPATVEIEEEQGRDETETAGFTTTNAVAIEEVATDETIIPEETAEEIEPEMPVEEEDVSADEAGTVEETVEEVQAVEVDNKEDSADEMVEDGNGTEEIVKENPEKEENKATDNDVPAQPETATENTDKPVRKNRRNLRFTISFIIGIIAGVGIVSMLGRNHADDAGNNDGTEEVSNQIVAETRIEPVVAVEDSADTIVVADVEIPADSVPVLDNSGVDNAYAFIMLDELAAKSDREITDADTALYVTDGDIAIHVVAEDERLAKIAYDYYGSRKLWPYIAKHNNLKNPYGLAVGMELSIPKLKPYK